MKPGSAQTVGSESLFARIVDDYPSHQTAIQRDDIPRMVFLLDLVRAAVPPGGRIADLGGGLGLFSPGCADAGYSAVLVDDFRDLANIPIAEEVLGRVHRPRSVEVVSRDIISQGIDFPSESLDAVTSFDSMEHWHNSPRRLFRQVMAALRPGGVLVIGVPNCVNLRKRLTVPFGIGKWSSMAEWYEADVFRGHVREPDVDDLRYIARDLGLVDCRIIGRNWLGYRSRFSWVRAATPIVDYALRPFPGLCSDLCLIGRKPAASSKS